MKICVVGCGMQGSVAAYDLSGAGHDVTVLDNNIALLRQLKKKCHVNARQFNVLGKVKFVKFLKRFDVVLCALPAALGSYTMDCAIKAGVDLVDMSYTADDPFRLDGKAKERGIKIVPDAGFAPGLSNVLIGETYRELKGIDTLKIMVGGLPQYPAPPFNYTITWSPVDLIEEYTRPTRIYVNGEVKVVETLTGLEDLTIPKVGKVECFYTDGLRTLLNTIRNAKHMEEKTIRYPGHADIFKTLIDCGFLSNENVHCHRNLVSIRDVTIEYLRTALRKGDARDLSIMVIEITRGSKRREYACVDYYDEKNDISSMARMTAYTGSVIAQCIKKYPENGIVTPEHLGMNGQTCSFIKSEIKKRNIHIKKH